MNQKNYSDPQLCIRITEGHSKLGIKENQSGKVSLYCSHLETKKVQCLVVMDNNDLISFHIPQNDEGKYYSMKHF